MRAVSLAVLLVAAPAAADTTVKIAALAPEGSSWMKLFRQWQQAVEKRTEGRVKLKFYPGGVQGDERDVLRKIKLGQLSGAAVTGIGLSAINPEVRTLDIARTYEQLDGLRAALGDTLTKKFDEKGYVLLGWGDVGPVHIFSKTPVRSIEDLRKTKLWVWSDDPISRQLIESLGVRGVPMGVPDVLPALSTGQVDAFFGTPLSTLALQWSGHAKYVTTLVVSQATGATVVAKKVWEAIAPADRAAIVDEGQKMQAAVLAQVRADNAKAMATMKAKGLEVIETPATMAKVFDERIEAVARESGKKLDPDFVARVDKLVSDYRAAQAKR